MKKVFKNFVLPFVFVLLATVVIGTGCQSPAPLIDYSDDDGHPPLVTVVSPEQNQEFYTSSALNITAYATDESFFGNVEVNILNQNGVLVAGLATAFTTREEDDSNLIGAFTNTIYTSLVEGNFIVQFIFEDIYGNESIETRTVVCIKPPIVDTDN